MSTEWQVRDLIKNRWEIHKVLRGGMGVVYVVYDHQFGEPLAAKTYHDAGILHPQIAARFSREALVWVNLDRHPYVTQARFVETIEHKPYLFLEYVAGGDLGAWIGTPRLTEDLRQVLQFAIQFCEAMVHAWSKGVKVHRDVKPENCLVTQDRTLKVTDFGLARVFDEPDAAPEEPTARSQFRGGAASGLSSTGEAFGTVTHMAPEQFEDAKHVDVRADVYSFGVLLFQMLTGRLPFVAQNPMEFLYRHTIEPPPPLPDHHPDLGSLIHTCLAKRPEDRFADFRSIKERLVALHVNILGEPPPEPPTGIELDALDWTNKGASLAALSRIEESVRCHERALELNPGFALAWANKGAALASQGKHDEALASCRRSLELDPHLAEAWFNQGAVLDLLGRHDQALASYEQALERNPRLADPWLNKGNHLLRLNRADEALRCCDRALALDPRNPMVWYNKALALAKGLGAHQDALTCLERVLELDPAQGDAWVHKGNALWELGSGDEAIQCYDRALALDPQARRAWHNKANALQQRGRHDEAVQCFDRLLGLDPDDLGGWTGKGNALRAQGRAAEALECYERAIALAPGEAGLWLDKGVTLEALGRSREALSAYERVLEIDPGEAQGWSNKGNLLWALGETESALACHDRAIELNPSHGNAWFNKGAVILNDLEDYRAALECFEQALRLGFAPAASAAEACRVALGA